MAREILKEFGGSPDGAQELARMTSDCPVAIVMGAQVLASHNNHPELIKDEDKFRTTLLGRDVVAGEIGRKADAEPIRKLLRVLALAQPFHPDDARSAAQRWRKSGVRCR